jgi:hypothetical protein
MLAHFSAEVNLAFQGRQLNMEKIYLSFPKQTHSELCCELKNKLKSRKNNTRLDLCIHEKCDIKLIYLVVRFLLYY